jgi:hypothetical protein
LRPRAQCLLSDVWTRDHGVANDEQSDARANRHHAALVRPGTLCLLRRADAHVPSANTRVWAGPTTSATAALPDAYLRLLTVERRLGSSQAARKMSASGPC